MMEPLSSQIAVMTTGGNHEIGSSEAWQSYNFRYPMPHRSSNSPSNLWWSRDVGPAHVIALCSYAATHSTSLQYKWLSRDLAAVDRSVTPWLIVMMHAPWYNSNIGHRGEAELMRQDMEALLYSYSVDLVLSGHVHAYERVRPVCDGCLDACGRVYLNLGDGGNREGAYVPWLEPQPPWSAARESSFGAGLLRLENATHAKYTWRRAACEKPEGPEHLDFDADDCATVVGQVGQPRQLGDRRRRGRRNVDRPRRRPAAARVPAARRQVRDAAGTADAAAADAAAARPAVAAGARAAGARLLWRGRHRRRVRQRARRRRDRRDRRRLRARAPRGRAVAGGGGLRQGERAAAQRRVAREYGCFGAAARDDAAGAGEWRGDAGVVASLGNRREGPGGADLIACAV